MKESAPRKFAITPNQYAAFEFNLERPTTLLLRMVATAPVNLLLLDPDDRAKYERGTGAAHTYTAAWGHRSDLETAIDVDPGTWYLIVEGNKEPSRGRVELFQRTAMPQEDPHLHYYQ